MRVQIEDQTYTIADSACIEIIQQLIKHGHLPSDIIEAISFQDLSEESIISSLNSLVDYALMMYNKPKLPVQLVISGGVKLFLNFLEKKVNTPEFTSLIRPPKRVDSVDHLASVIRMVIPFVAQKAVEGKLNALVVVTTTDDKEIEHVQFSKN